MPGGERAIGRKYSNQQSMTYNTKALSALNAASRATYFGGAMRTWLNRRRPIGTVLSVLALRQYISKMDGERIFAIAVFSG
jgi:hypothetical protein